MTNFPWCDRSGRFSPLKAATFAGLLLPALAAAIDLLDGSFAAEPAKQTIHALGLWTIRLILLALAVTPAMQIFRLPKLVQLRRMIGVAAFAYGTAHLCAYVAQQNFDLAHVAHEIGARFYLALGLGALLMLAALAATSTDAMIRRMGARRWRLLHRAVYLAAALGLVHYFIQSKLVVTEPTIFAGLFLWLMLYRALLWTAGARRAARPQALALLGLASAALTMTGEAIGYTLFTPADGIQVFAANFTFVAGLRPGWFVLLFGAAVAGAAVIRGPVMSVQPLARSAVP
ncbi:MAG: ferric reductase-like transmembrane domain-containing protein [Alphaproteobacteria bacterium]|nr:ferric reductase-like transmembrane domain-containing protein [Alphaproteobacteria bacterium]